MEEPKVKWLSEVTQLLSSSVSSQPSRTTSNPTLVLFHQWWPAHSLQLHNKTGHLVFEFSLVTSQRSSNIKIFSSCLNYPLLHNYTLWQIQEKSHHFVFSFEFVGRLGSVRWFCSTVCQLGLQSCGGLLGPLGFNVVSSHGGHLGEDSWWPGLPSPCSLKGLSAWSSHVFAPSWQPTSYTVIQNSQRCRTESCWVFVSCWFAAGVSLSLPPMGSSGRKTNHPSQRREWRRFAAFLNPLQCLIRIAHFLLDVLLSEKVEILFTMALSNSVYKVLSMEKDMEIEGEIL